jgi:maltose phosphorylase
MKNHIKADPWKIIEEGFSAALHPVSESIFSIGNGKMGQRANFEEKYSGETLRGSYVAGVYYPDKTRVGWWKNGYPEYFAKVLNAANWIGIDVTVDGEELDLATAEVESFTRVLHMKSAFLERRYGQRRDPLLGHPAGLRWDDCVHSLFGSEHIQQGLQLRRAFLDRDRPLGRPGCSAHHR